MQLDVALSWGFRLECSRPRASGLDTRFNDKTDKELCNRWMQFVAFTPCFVAVLGFSARVFASAGKWAGHSLSPSYCKWEYMYFSIQGILQHQLSQIPFVGADTCRFNDNTDKELCNRWIQFVAFTPRFVAVLGFSARAFASGLFSIRVKVVAQLGPARRHTPTFMRHSNITREDVQADVGIVGNRSSDKLSHGYNS
ncbi:glycosyl hydrolases family 31-domain-containing protein [Mycena olivaceomarginata]|nr:glycosyl hydrolases family 31-domain-containing protein [Mycena olivaceomarginata]